MDTDPAPSQAEQTAFEQENRALRARIAVLEELEQRYHVVLESTNTHDALVAAFRRLQFVVDQITEIYFSLDHHGRFVAMNAVAARAFFRHPADTLMGRVCWEEFPQVAGTDFYRQISLAVEHNQPAHFETQLALTGGWYEAHVYPTGQTVEIFLRDISLRMRAYQELIQNREEYRQLAETAQINLSQLETVVDNMVEGLIIINPQGEILTMNPTARQMFLQGQSPRVVKKLGELFATFECLYPDGTDCPYEEWPLIRAAGGEKVAAQELITISNDSGKRWYGLFNATPIHDENDEIKLIVTTILDITDQRKLADEMQHSMVQIGLQRMIMQDREMERVKIAQDLHDGPLQHILGLDYDLTDALSIDDKQARMALLAQLRNNLRGAAQVLRAFCADLRPPSLAAFGMEKAIRSHVEQVGMSHPELHCSMELMPDGQTLAVETRMVLFRIYQELMTNIIRHSGASEVGIRLTLDEAQVELEIQDNGRGFTPPSHWIELAHQDHFGLVGVQERASAAGGRVILRSQHGEGTLVRVVIPVQSEPNGIS
jgi:PAS domain S-box-containing protein